MVQEKENTLIASFLMGIPSKKDVFQLLIKVTTRYKPKYQYIYTRRGNSLYRVTELTDETKATDYHVSKYKWKLEVISGVAYSTDGS